MKLAISHLILLPLTFAAGACAPAAGTQAHEMSAAEHQAAAKQEESDAEAHAAKYHPEAPAVGAACKPSRGRVCWTEWENPSKEHQISAAEHHDLAAKHRAASKELTEAEASACSGLSDEDRDISPFAHGADISSVTQLKEEKRAGKATTTRDAGATVVFRAAPGLTAEWLQRIVDCHLARNAAVGHNMPQMSYCPLVPRGVQAKVHSSGGGFAVDIRSDDPETVAEIWKRAQQLKIKP
ncbi:MAG: hypothetical protein SFV15_19680 [Polyangiaceae bacterium]|nr:hypothetical protein [Polyangiaceae bacterium]